MTSGIKCKNVPDLVLLPCGFSEEQLRQQLRLLHPVRFWLDSVQVSRDTTWCIRRFFCNDEADSKGKTHAYGGLAGRMSATE